MELGNWIHCYHALEGELVSGLTRSKALEALQWAIEDSERIARLEQLANQRLDSTASAWRRKKLGTPGEAQDVAIRVFAWFQLRRAQCLLHSIRMRELSPICGYRALLANAAQLSSDIELSLGEIDLRDLLQLLPE